MDFRDMRKQAGLSQSEVAERTGIAQSTISRIEHGRQSVTLSQLERIAQACGFRLRLVRATGKRRAA